MVFRQIDCSADVQDAILDPHINITFLDSWHFKNDCQSILRFIDVGYWKKYSSRNRGLLAFLLLALLLNLQFLSSLDFHGTGLP